MNLTISIVTAGYQRTAYTLGQNDGASSVMGHVAKGSTRRVMLFLSSLFRHKLTLWVMQNMFRGIDLIYSAEKDSEQLKPSVDNVISIC